MFIELTDHLRCPAEHDESFLVLLPDTMAGRSVVSGQLGCPICGRAFRVERGEWDAGGAPIDASDASKLDASAVVTLGGIEGPGGYVVLVGAVAGRWREVAAASPGISFVAVNPGTDVSDEPGVSVLRGARIPLKTNSMRGVVLGPGYGGDPSWVDEAARVTLPGLRIVGEGPPPVDLVDVMANADGVWVGTKRR